LPPKRKIVKSNVSSVVEIILWITRDVWSTNSYKIKHTLLFDTIHSSLQTKHIQYTQTGVTYASITKRHSYSHTNIVK
jgi:hypothetical protein